MASRGKSQYNSKPQSGYTVLARRYRSRDFDELIGQEPIARTLQNAIKSNRTAHAYLFCGTRGVGKTSMARIFAKALNATDDLSQKKEIAEAILRGEDLDVIEIDGASNRGIDNARDLIAGASLSPTRSRYKIYIIDEVHMLTRESFNALLKTMEEPPSHVKFILCTTDPHKVPATIQSRCQRFDFRAIPTIRIAEQLRNILKQEELKADDEVIMQVARLGNGSMRDALSLMDRLLAGGDQKIDMQYLEQMLGLPDHSLIVKLVDAIVASDPKAALECGSELLASGSTVEQSLEMLADHFRTLMVVAACGADVDLLDVSEESRRSAAAQASHFDAPALVHMIAICDAIGRNSRTSSAARALFDAGIVRLAMSERFVDIANVLSGSAPAPSRSSPQVSSAADSKKKAVKPISPQPLAGSPSLASAKAQPEAAPHIVAEVKSVTDDQLWACVLEVASKSIGDKTRTEHLVFESFDGRTLKLSIDDTGADIARYLSRETDRIADLVKRATGKSVRIELDVDRFQSRPASANAAPSSAQVPQAVKKAIEVFDATLVSIEDLGTPQSPTLVSTTTHDFRVST